ncbi:MAG: hypothetical protein AAGI48_13325 [Verrucomicrobiota bacterium]
MQRSDARLWLAALLGSAVLNGLIIVILALLALSELFVRQVPPVEEKQPETRSVTIVPIMPEAEPEAAPPKGFARSSPDQISERPENPSFIGEHDTQATSDAPVIADAPEQPSQTGEKPEYGEVETTESDYQDGDLAHDQIASPGEAQPSIMPSEQVEAETELSEAGGTEQEIERKDDPAPTKEVLAETPFPVERPVLPMTPEDEPMPAPEEIKADAEKTEEEKQVAEDLKPATPSPTGNPGFRGNQRKTELKGSISRTGRSALDIEAGELGKYHAAISRAIEKSWQRQVIRNLDYVKPGVLRIRVVLDPAGKVRSVGTVEEVGIGAIQKGFTHTAIRDADLPKMPAEVKEQLEGEPLELLYNFIF